MAAVTSAASSAASAAAARLGAALSDAQYFESTMVRVEDIRRQLDSRHTKEKLDAMKRVIALISLGKDASTFFPDVVKNVVATSLDVKKLVYLYLVHYAEQKQDLALLAINSFQKDLSDHNQHIRALSLRVLSSIRVKVILQVVIMAISKAAKDSSSYVRNAAAHAIGKVCALEPPSRDLLLEPLQDLVADRSTQVMGSAIASYEHVCPYRWQMIHPHYRRICNSLNNVHPWGQISILTMLLRYARVHFEKPTHHRNPDLTLLIQSTKPLFHSLNNAVVASTIALYYHLATEPEFCDSAVKPLMRLVAIDDDGGQAVALTIASAVAARFPAVLIPYLTELHVSPAHSPMIAKFRMQVMTTICETAGCDGGIGSKPNARKMLLTELKSYLHRRDDFLAAASARAIGCLATAHPGSTPAIVKVLSSVVQSTDNPSVVAESIGVLRRLLQRHPSAQARALPQLIAMLLSTEKDSIEEPAARASIIWLIAEFYEKVQAVATEALRLLTKGFAKEHAYVKLQILNLAAKVVACGKEGDDDNVSLHVRKKLLEYVVSCARYDQDYDVRDKARMFDFLFVKGASPGLYKAACQAFLSKKPTPLSMEHAKESGDELEADVVIGSMAHVLKGRRLPGFRPLEPWAVEDSDGALREEVVGSGEGAAVTREYLGVSSSDYQISGAISSSSAGWGTPITMASNAILGKTAAILGKTAESAPLPPKQMHHDTARSNADPERFYAEAASGDGGDDDDDDDEEYDDDDDDDEGDEDGEYSEEEDVNGNVKTSTEPKTGDLLEDLLTPSEPAVASRSQKKSTSEYDLDALLGGVTVSSPIADNKSPAEIMSKLSITGTPPPPSPLGSRVNKTVRSEWQRVLEPWNCMGMQVDAAYMRAASPIGADVTPVSIRIINRSTMVAQVGLLSQCDDAFVPGPGLTVPPNHAAELSASARFQKKNPVAFGVMVNSAQVANAELKPSTGYVVRPYPSITPNDISEAEKALAGMFSSEAEMQLGAPTQGDWMELSTDLRARVLETCFLAHIRTSVGVGEERFSSVFAGKLGKHVVLLRLRAGGSRDSVAVKVWIGCEDVLYAARLMTVCKEAVQKCCG